MNQTLQSMAIPSLAVEKWVKRWTEKYPEAQKIEALTAFNKEFSLLAGNTLLEELFEKNFKP